MKLTIQKIYRNNTTKDGKPIMSRDGKIQLTKVALLTKEYGSEYVRGFEGFWNKNWQIGDAVDVDVYKTTGDNGREWTNFKRPDPIRALELRVEKLENEVFNKGEETPDDIDDVSAEIAGDDVPF